jgi:hypothetical protein
MIFGLQGSIIEANSIMTQEDAIKYLMSHAMFTPINMDKNLVLKRKENLPWIF